MEKEKCKHNWEGGLDISKSQPSIWLYPVIFRCRKCGKVKQKERKIAKKLYGYDVIVKSKPPNS